jgi:hypothetical protein
VPRRRSESVSSFLSKATVDSFSLWDDATDIKAYSMGKDSQKKTRFFLYVVSDTIGCIKKEEALEEENVPFVFPNDDVPTS